MMGMLPRSRGAIWSNTAALRLSWLVAQSLQVSYTITVCVVLEKAQYCMMEQQQQQQKGSSSVTVQSLQVSFINAVSDTTGWC
jgi:hypothetical protein